jgi:hypothetical protein
MLTGSKPTGKGTPMSITTPPPPGGSGSTKAPRPWYKKKRFIFPIAFFAILFVIGSFNNGSGDTTPSASAETHAPSSASTPASPDDSSSSTPAPVVTVTETETATATQLPPPSPTKTATTKPVVVQHETVAQEQARGSAEDYLSTQAFSRKSLIEQLKFEGFSTAVATYAVDAQHESWSAEAYRDAKEYLSTEHFSRSGLIEQLEYEGFTPAQALYGVRRVGL